MEPEKAVGPSAGRHPGATHIRAERTGFSLRRESLTVKGRCGGNSGLDSPNHTAGTLPAGPRNLQFIAPFPLSHSPQFKEFETKRAERQRALYAGRAGAGGTRQMVKMLEGSVARTFSTETWCGEESAAAAVSGAADGD